jgi:5-methyltetrahydrofolate--homocysteine methyltransferase
LEVLTEISGSVQRGDHENAAVLTKQAVADGIPAKEILDGGLIAAMDVVGERFRKHEIFLPDVLLSAKAMYAGMDVLKPLLIEGDVPNLGKVVIGSVRGDLHDIGKNLVGIMLRGAGFEVIDLGNDVAPERFVDAAAEEGAHVIGMSALLTTTMPTMKAVVELVEGRGLSDDVKTIVGGAPVSAEFAREIGADAYGFDAANAVVRVKELMDIS